MGNWLSKFLRRKPEPTISPEDANLETFFTDLEHLRGIFYELVEATTLPKRLLVIHGVGGAGKSTLLHMFRLHCKREGIPVAFVSGAEAKTSVEVLQGFARDLNQDNITLSNLEQTLKQYHAIQAQVEREEVKLSKVAKGGARVAVEVAAGYIPVVGPVVAAVGGMGAEAFIDWVRGFLSKPELDLYLDPSTKLTDDFLNDLTYATKNCRLVLMLDTYEQMTGLDDWVRALVKQLPTNVLIVIAGRASMGRKWDREWPGWMMQARIEPLGAMTEDNMRMLVHRYYATMRESEPNPKQVEDVVRFSRGLPLVVTSAVRMWVRYGVEDFHAVKPQVAADLVDRLMENTPSEMRPIIEAAAVLRWFNKELLRVLLSDEQVEIGYDELRRFPFVHTRIEGLALHDVIRELLNENLKSHDPARHRLLNEKASKHYANLLKTVENEKSGRIRLELLYHYLQVSEKQGIAFFCQMCEDYANAHLVHHLRTTLDAASAMDFISKDYSLWQDYYKGRLYFLEARLPEVEALYKPLIDNEEINPRLRAYAMCDLGSIWCRFGILGQEGMQEKTNAILQKSLTLAPLDEHLVTNYFSLAHACAFRGEWSQGMDHLKIAEQFYAKNENTYGLIHVYAAMSDLPGLQGNWKHFFELREKVKQAVASLQGFPYLKTVNGRLAGIWVLAGRYAEAEILARDSMEVHKRLETIYDYIVPLTDLGLVLGKQRKFHEAEIILNEEIEIADKLGAPYKNWQAMGICFKGIFLISQGKYAQAKEFLETGLRIKEEVQDRPGLPEILNWLGMLHEVQSKWDIALNYYQRSLEKNIFSRYYLEAEALVGLCRTKYHQREFAEISKIALKAGKLAQQYEYNDHLAMLHLIKGKIAWEEHFSEWGTGFDAVLFQYQKALIYALRYDRFLLDEVLWGDNIATPLDPIVHYCQGKGDEGRKMLMALRDWWQIGINDTGIPRPDTISPIPEGISLLEAERIVRQREPGNGLPQRTVVELLEQALVDQTEVV